MQSTYDRIQYYKIEEKQKKVIIDKLKDLISHEKDVKIAWLFGSLTRGDSVRDLDIAIHAEPEKSFKDYLDLNAQIELELGYPVDMVEIAKVPASLQQRIYREGILIKGTKALQEQLEKKTV